MEESSGSLAPARNAPISQAQAAHIAHTLQSVSPLMSHSSPAGRSVPATAATSMLTIVPVDENGNALSVSRPQTAGGGAGNNDQSGGSGKDQSSDPVSTADDNGGEGDRQESTSATQAEAVQQTALTFLLVSGRRRTMNFDPDTTIGRVKELVWNAWPTDWKSEQPPAPSYLRILYLGKILQDEDTLSKLSMPVTTIHPTTGAPASPPTIVHLSIRPIALPSEDESTLKKKGTRVGRRATQRATNPTAGEGNVEEAPSGSCCGCVIC